MARPYGVLHEFQLFDVLFFSEGNLNIKTRMPFGKARMILPRPMFDPALPMVSKVEPCKLLKKHTTVAIYELLEQINLVIKIIYLT